MPDVVGHRRDFEKLTFVNGYAKDLLDESVDDGEGVGFFVGSEFVIEVDDGGLEFLFFSDRILFPFQISKKNDG